MSLTSLVLRFAAPAPDPLSFDRFLFIGPHPDDIEIGAGATVAKLTAMGKNVQFLICTDGRFGLENAAPGTSPEALAEIRRSEALRAAQVLGVKQVHFLNFSDGGLYDVKDLLRRAAEIVGQVRPEVLFAPDPCVDSECHADHLNAGRIARELAFFSPFPEIMQAYGAESAPVKALAYYMTAKPNRFVGVRDTLPIQRRAVLCHESQFPEGSEALRSLSLYLKLRAADFGLRSLKGQAEGFRVLGTVQMHCLPEAG